MSQKDAIEEIGELMKTGNSATIEKILDKFVIMDKNLILKTDIENSKNFTILRVLEEELKIRGLKKSYRTLHNFCEWYIKVRVSNHRLSRKEILEAISAIRKENAQSSTIGAKLFGLGRKEE